MIQRNSSGNQPHIEALDGLRGLAALIVVGSHTSNSGMYFLPFLDLRGVGKSGVFLFFVLSSFLLALPLLRVAKEVFTLSVMSHYWQRRIFRIYPLYILYLLAGVVSTWIITVTLGKPGVGVPFALDWAGFFSHIALLEGKGVTWSIVVEFKFYFVLPFLVLGIALVRSGGATLTVLFCLLLLVLSQVVSPQSESLKNDARLLPYMPIFIMGIFLAVLQDYVNGCAENKAVVRIFRWLGYLGGAGIVLMTPSVFSILGDRVPNDHFHRQFILYALFWSFILMSSVNVDGIIQKLFSLPVLRFYGALSFSLYLLHPIFIQVFAEADVNGYISSWGVLLCSTLMAYWSFNLVEGPISRYKLNRGSLVPIANLARNFVRGK